MLVFANFNLTKMKHIYLLFAVFIFTACSKEDTYGPWKLKDGQEVELLVSHRYGAIGDTPLLLPQNASPQFPLSSFDEREPGYNYRVKARMVAYKGPQMMDDGPTSVLQFIEVISKEKYEGKESFELQLIQQLSGLDWWRIMLLKQDGDYHFIPADITLTHANEQVREQLEEIWQHNEELIENYQKDGTPPEAKWRANTATVSHDPDNFGKAYRVSHIEFKD